MRLSALALTLTLAIIPGFSQYKHTPADSVGAKNLQEIVVTDQSARNRVNLGKLGSENLELTRLALTPQLFGETDIVKSITLLPGVRGEGEGVGGFEVRGGNAYQNLVTMDGMNLYNPAHMMGIFSTFNDDAMGRATLHKGPVPAYFGGASSSVLETYMKPGNMTHWNFSGTVGILNAKLSADGPIVKEKLSAALAVRRSYVDLFLNLMPKYRGTVMNFFDTNVRLRYNIDRNNIMDVSFFAARDNLAVSDIMEMHWGNVAGSVNLNSRVSDKWRFITTASATNYTTDMGSSVMGADQTLTEYIRSFSLNERVIYDIYDNHSLEFGLRAELLGVKSGDMYIGMLRQREIRSAMQNAVWVGYEASFSSGFSLSAGLRGSWTPVISSPHFHKFEAMNETSPDFSAKNYIYLEPRGSLKFNINEWHNIKAGASLTTQNLHGLRSSMTTFPFDRYSLTSSCVKPEKTWLYSVGYAGMTSDGTFDWTVEGYYKNMGNVYDYRDGVSMFSRMNLESLILCGKGRSHGLEVMFRKNVGKLTGWVAYTLSKTETRIPGINDGRWYRASNDRRNDIAVVGMYDFNDKWKVSASWTYSSGRPLTAPDEKYEIGGMTCYYYTERNSYITPASHRLDLSATYTRKGRRATSIWSFGVFNAYAHYSPFIIYFEDDPDKPSGTRAVQQSLFGLVPSVSYTIQF